MGLVTNKTEQSCPALVHLTVKKPADKDWHGIVTHKDHLLFVAVKDTGARVHK